MRTVTLPFRKAVYQALVGLEYDGVVINTFESNVLETPTKQISVITVGNMEVKVWIILKNQTSNDNSSKQERNDQTSLQVQVKTEWPKDKGNSEIAELIMDSVTQRLFNWNGLFKGIEMEYPFRLWKLDYIGDRNLDYPEDDSYVWMKNLDILGHVNQDVVNFTDGFDYALDFALA